MFIPLKSSDHDLALSDARNVKPTVPVPVRAPGQRAPPVLPPAAKPKAKPRAKAAGKAKAKAGSKAKAAKVPKVET